MSTMVLLNGVRELPCALENVLEYRNPVLAQRFQDKLGISQEVAEQLFEDTKKFLYLCAASEKPISPNKTLDFGWHEFILFTEDYTDFCQKYFGHFIHHRPRHPNDPPTKREGGRRTLELAHQVFGDNLSENWEYSLSDEEDTPCDSCGCASECTDGP